MDIWNIIDFNFINFKRLKNWCEFIFQNQEKTSKAQCRGTNSNTLDNKVYNITIEWKWEIRYYVYKGFKYKSSSSKNFEIYIHAIFISYHFTLFEKWFGWEVLALSIRHDQTKTFVDNSNRVKTLSLFLYFLARRIEKKVHRKCNKGGGYH